jgi:CHAD domain-containing protein
LSVGGVVEERPWRQAGAAGGESAAAFDALAPPVRDFARHALNDCYARVTQAGRGFDRMTVEERHALRIELKRMRYTADFFAALYPAEAVRPFLKSLSRLQDVFGYLNDAAVAERMARKLARRAGEIRGVLREAVGLVAGWHGHRAAEEWKQARKRWQAFRKIAPFWQ